MAIENHGRIRQEWGLPPQAPASADGIKCDFCVNRCRIDDGGRGYCGLRQNIQGQLEGVTAHRGKLSWYHDPLPTNCVGDWICPGGTGCGYPTFAYKEGPDYGY